MPSWLESENSCISASTPDAPERCARTSVTSRRASSCAADACSGVIRACASTRCTQAASSSRYAAVMASRSADCGRASWPNCMAVIVLSRGGVAVLNCRRCRPGRWR